MPAREERIEIRCEAQEIFDLIHDYDRRLEWDSFLKKAGLLDGATKAGSGVHTLCIARNMIGGLAMEAIYISYNPPRVAAIAMTRGPVFFKSFAATLLQKAVARGVTQVIYRYNFRTRPGWLSFLLDPIVEAVFSREVRSRLRGLKRVAESGTV
ncbi:MAG TPA: SRPBCC family protein [Gemmataceae bacterium]|nr:SRPBCC family protein [Gemmataceae bacterium]